MIRSTHKIQIPVLDGFRALAILMVLIYHLGLNTNFYPLRLISYGGWMGVQLFFILSGFLLSLDYLIAAKERINMPLLSDFYRNRVLRIFPLYFLGLSVYILFNFLNKTLTDQTGLISYFVFLQNFSVERWPIYDSYWSLAVEVQIYIVFPLIGYRIYKAISNSKMGSLVLYLIMLTIAPLLYRIYISIWHVDVLSETYYIYWIYKSSFSNFDSFGWGIVGAIIYVNVEPNKIVKSVGYILMVISFGMIIWLLQYSLTHRSWYLIDGFFAPAFIYTLINISWVSLIVSLLVISEGWLVKICSNRIIQFVARISFGLYVWHGIVFYATRKLAKYLLIQERIELNVFIFFVALIGTALIATLSYYYVEMPFLRLKVKRVESKKAVG